MASITADFEGQYLGCLARLKELGLTERAIFTITIFLIHLVTFYMHAWLFVLADWYQFLDRWSIRSGRHRLPSVEKQWEAIKEGTLDALVIKPIVVYFAFPIASAYISFGNLPTLGQGCLQWLLMELIFSTSLFWIHGAMHYFPVVYKYVHKRHHTFHETVAFAAQYSHPLEGIAASFHTIVSILLVRPHFLVMCVFLATTFIEIVDSHCGYDVPWSVLYPWSGIYPWGSGAKAHDFHHSHNIGMYGGGLTGLWDALMGTDKEFRQFYKNRPAQEKMGGDTELKTRKNN